MYIAGLSLMMSDIFYLRPVTPPVRLEDLPEMASQAQGCFGLHRVNWRMSFLSLDGSEMLCWYRAPDTESARVALRQLGADMRGVWPGRPEWPLDGEAADSLTAVSVLAVVPAALTAELRETITGLVKTYCGELVCRIGALDGSRSIWLFHSVEVGDVYRTFFAHGIPDTQVWDCRVFVPRFDSDPIESH